MAEKVSKKRPVVERITEFNQENQQKNSEVIIINGLYIMQITEEYTIVEYRCNKINELSFETTNYLNAFIESIKVSNVFNFKEYYVKDGILYSEIIRSGIAIYYKENSGIRQTILNGVIRAFLLEEPNLVISPEGILIFYTERHIMATVDCKDYCWISSNIIDIIGKKVKSIESCDTHCKVILVDNEKNEHYFNLKFELNILKRQIICPKVSES